MQDLLRRLRNSYWPRSDGYEPEKHYMRGPGPKWHEKHAQREQSDGGGFPGSVDVGATTKVTPDTQMA